MRRVRFDSIGGAAGNMILGALVDLGANPDELYRQLATLRIEPFRFEIRPAGDGALSGTHLEVSVARDPEHARRLADIRGLVDGSRLPDRTRRLAMRVFERLAEAEAAVHGCTPEEVHFHEVGALDAVVDIAGACLALELLGIDEVTVGPLPLGTGTTAGAHGTMPIPVPATAALLQGHPVLQTDEPFELVTPTGAALLTTWRDALPPAAPAAPRLAGASGTGFGTRRLRGRPNALRASLYEETPDAPDAACRVLECTVDDTVPELLGPLLTKLLEQGALDVFTTAVQMKKQRPGQLLTVLCEPGCKDRLIDTIFRETTSFGIREYPVERTVLARRHETVQTPYGGVRVKIGAWRGDDVTHSPEHEDCVRAAAEHGVAVRRVYEAALAAAAQFRP